MEAIAEKVYFLTMIPRCDYLNEKQVIRDSINDLNSKASQQALPAHLASELLALVVLSTHRIEKARDIASKYLNRLITSFPSLMCDPTLIFAIWKSSRFFSEPVKMSILMRYGWLAPE